MKFLKKEKEKKRKSLKLLLHKSIAKNHKARSNKILHASDLTKDDFCAREFALYRKLEKQPPDQFVGTSLRLTFDYGRF